MDETQAASSPAEVDHDVFQGEQPTLDEYSRYRASGELPARFKPAEPAESAPADTQQETEEAEAEKPEPAPESDPEEAQELKPKTAKRIQQLLEKTRELERRLAEKEGVKTDPPPAPAEAATRPKPKAEDTNSDGSPKFSTYEDFVEDLADWKAEQRMEAAKRESQQQEQLKALQTKLETARTRYDDADDVIFPAGKTIHESQIPQAVKAVFEESEVFLDLCYVVGSDPDELQKFIALAKTNPRAAIGKVFEYERGIKDELAPQKAPEAKKTSAPKPPSPVGGASSRAFDVSDDSLSPDEWMRKRNKQLGKV